MAWSSQGCNFWLLSGMYWWKGRDCYLLTFSFLIFVFFTLQTAQVWSGEKKLVHIKMGLLKQLKDLGEIYLVTPISKWSIPKRQMVVTQPTQHKIIWKPWPRGMILCKQTAQIYHAHQVHLFRLMWLTSDKREGTSKNKFFAWALRHSPYLRVHVHTESWATCHY